MYCRRFLTFSLILTAVLLTVFLQCNTVLSKDTVSKLEMTAYPEDKIQSYVRELSLRYLSEEPPPSSLCCFDVCEDGRIAVGFQNKKIAVYSPQGTFLYGFSFDASGSFSLLWNDGNICIYFMRSDILATFDAEGTCVGFAKLIQSYNNQEIVRKEIDVTKRQVGEIQYSLENDLPISVGAARLVAQYADGTRKVIYDATSAHNTATMLVSLVLIAFFVGIILYLLQKYRKRYTNR